jgi:hypothetical protein
VIATRTSNPRIHVIVRPPLFTSLPLWMVVSLLAVATAGWMTWSTLTASEDPITAPLRSPADARQEEILKTAIDSLGDRQLGQLYQSINLKHFNGALLSMPVAWEPRLEEVGALAGHTYTLQGMFGRLGDRTIILLHPALQSDPQAARRALCHEMVHAYLFAQGDSSSAHGPAFQAVLKRLASEGAFVGIVATDQEREALRRWLDLEGARLEAQRVELERLGQEIEADRLLVESAMIAPVEAADVEAVNAQRDAYNRRAFDANARAERHREAVAAYQREMERYNLMVVYPDGR